MKPLKTKRIITEGKFKMRLTSEMNLSWRKMITKNKIGEFNLKKNKKERRMKRTTKQANKMFSKIIKSQPHEDTLHKCLKPQTIKTSRTAMKVMVALWQSISKDKEFQIPKVVEEQTSFHTEDQCKEFPKEPQICRCMSIPSQLISSTRPTSQPTGLNQQTKVTLDTCNQPANPTDLATITWLN